jgi:hypothetical protein
MPIRRRSFLFKLSESGRATTAGTADLIAIAAKGLYSNIFCRPIRSANGHRIRVGGRSFQKLKQPLRRPPVFGGNCLDLCVAQKS